jgi:uncharacterized protein
MSPAPADQVNAKELAGRTASIERSLDLRQLPRVAEAGALKGTQVHAELRFATFKGRTTVGVQLEGLVVLACQRCLKPCETRLDEAEQVMVVATAADADQVAGGYEPFIGDVESLSLTALIEEQVLLGLPLVPMHEDPGLCRKSASGRIVAKVEAEAQPEDTQTPFANLRDLLGKSEH